MPSPQREDGSALSKSNFTVCGKWTSASAEVTRSRGAMSCGSGHPPTVRIVTANTERWQGWRAHALQVSRHYNVRVQTARRGRLHRWAGPASTRDDSGSRIGCPEYRDALWQVRVFLGGGLLYLWRRASAARRCASPDIARTGRQRPMARVRAPGAAFPATARGSPTGRLCRSELKRGGAASGNSW